MLKPPKPWSQKWPKLSGELSYGTTRKRGMHRDMKFSVFITVCRAPFRLLRVVYGTERHLPAWCCTAEWRCAAGGWPPLGAEGHCGTWAGWWPPLRESSGRSDRLVLRELLASVTPFQTIDARNKVSATISQFCRAPRAFHAAKEKQRWVQALKQANLIICFLYWI